MKTRLSMLIVIHFRIVGYFINFRIVGYFGTKNHLYNMDIKN